MGIEQNLERIASALEKLVTLNEGTLEQRVRITRCAEFNAVRNGMVAPEASFPELQCNAVEEEAVIVDNKAPAEPEAAEEGAWTYDTLKAALIARGVEILPRTKMTTLLKLWEKHKNAPLASEAPAEPEAPADDIFGDAPVTAALKDEFAIPVALAPEKAREIIATHYDRSEADKANLLSALTFVDPNCTTFLSIPEGKHGAVVARFLELKGIKAEAVADIVNRGE